MGLRRVKHVERVEDWKNHKSPNPPIHQSSNDTIGPMQPVDLVTVNRMARQIDIRWFQVLAKPDRAASLRRQAARSAIGPYQRLQAARSMSGSYQRSQAARSRPEVSGVRPSALRSSRIHPCSSSGGSSRPRRQARPPAHASPPAAYRCGPPACHAR